MCNGYVCGMRINNDDDKYMQYKYILYEDKQ